MRVLSLAGVIGFGADFVIQMREHNEYLGTAKMLNRASQDGFVRNEIGLNRLYLEESTNALKGYAFALGAMVLPYAGSKTLEEKERINSGA